jgi:hypothetical protein
MPDLPDMAGPPQRPWVARPFYPTAPLFSTNPRTGHQVRRYMAELLPTAADYAVGSEALRSVGFDIPVRLVAINGAAFPTGAGNAFPIGQGPRTCWLFRSEYTQGDRLDVSASLASNVVGTAERPGEIGAQGWTLYAGATLQVGITPLLANLRIQVTFVVLETRGQTNHG